MESRYQRPAIDARKLKRASYRNNTLYRLFLEVADCGPLDGGCKVFALALQRLIGGVLYVVEGTNQSCTIQQAQHVVVLAHDLFWDVEGGRSAKALLKRLRRMEGIENGVLRPYRDGDVPCAVDNPALVTSVYKHLHAATA